jgi:hypothetical protein
MDDDERLREEQYQTGRSAIERTRRHTMLLLCAPASMPLSVGVPQGGLRDLPLLSAAADRYKDEEMEGAVRHKDKHSLASEKKNNKETIFETSADLVSPSAGFNNNRASREMENGYVHISSRSEGTNLVRRSASYDKRHKSLRS